MYTKAIIQRRIWTISTVVVVCIVAGYAAVAASTHLRQPTVVVTFNIENVVADLTEKADSEARLRALVMKIEDERKKRLNVIDELRASMGSVSDADRVAVAEQVARRGELVNAAEVKPGHHDASCAPSGRNKLMPGPHKGSVALQEQHIQLRVASCETCVHQQVVDPIPVKVASACHCSAESPVRLVAAHLE